MFAAGTWRTWSTAGKTERRPATRELTGSKHITLKTDALYNGAPVLLEAHPRYLILRVPHGPILAAITYRTLIERYAQDNTGTLVRQCIDAVAGTRELAHVGL
ncbi:MAG: hypothetical protein ABSE56_02550 [Bryobacteraceae bacterium]|jgi:hypothetical protein